MKRKQAYFKYIAALLLFGVNGIIASHISLTSYEIVLTRTCIGSLFLGLLFMGTRQKSALRNNKKQLPFLIVSGAAMGASWMFLYEAYTQLGVSIASLAYYCGPVIVMALSPFLFKEKITWIKLSGFAGVLIGMFFVNSNAIQQGGNFWGLFCGGMSAIMYAIMVVCNKKAKHITGLENALWQLISGFATVAVFVGLKQGFALRIQPSDWPPILLLGILNTGIGCYFYFSSIGKLPVQTVAICGYIEPLSALVFSSLFLAEKLTRVQLIGAVFILGGAAFSELWKPTKHSTKTEKY